MGVGLLWAWSWVGKSCSAWASPTRPPVGLTRLGWGWMEASLPWSGSPRAQWSSWKDGQSPMAGSSHVLPRRHCTQGQAGGSLSGDCFFRTSTRAGDFGDCRLQRGRRQKWGECSRNGRNQLGPGGFHPVLTLAGLYCPGDSQPGFPGAGSVEPKGRMHSRWASAAHSHFLTGLFSASKSQPPATHPLASGGEAGLPLPVLPSPVQTQGQGVWVSPLVSRAPLISPHSPRLLATPQLALGAAAVARRGRSSGHSTCAHHVAQATCTWGTVCACRVVSTKPELGEVLQFGFAAQQDRWGGRRDSSQWRSQDWPCMRCPLGVQACPGPLQRERLCF
ncbi:uncharacterized protein LOC130705882 [Balaenoptera acutorostrata]|uniref:Uncharacterized protein LOC130705882 n=1 Tax=Balaenoptera acutorostrata TaxID=9767 RepID=A0ABM3SPK8_BALAC|nr:uncharacterized protein LOC130705882 [Balaenoptera acutorostrata]